MAAPVLMGVFAFLLCVNACAAQEQAASVLSFDASGTFPQPGPAQFNPGASVAPGGHTLGLNSRYLTRDGRPWLPVAGEFHFSRYPRSEWESELLKMKAAGVDIVATYVIWIHHEEIEGKIDWTGDRDLRAFAQLCAKHGLLLEPRIGPWAHAEVRNGGLPDWVLRQSRTRVNDPAYLAAVTRWYNQIGLQLKGMMWSDGGPVVAIQLENEYSSLGQGAGEEHILTLKKMALAAGFDVPYYFVTGWDNAVVPMPEVLPVYGGGYPDSPWSGEIGELPPAEVYAFRFTSRVAANMGAIGDGAKNGERATATEPVPYLTAEIGGGNEVTYHRRPVIHADDIGAMFPVMLGSGVNLYGSYMFHGGTNPDGVLSTLQESQATDYPNDVPIKSYDFQAPIGEFGQERPSLGKMRLYQYFLNSFGEDLAPMAVVAPDRQPHDTADLSVPRAAVRVAGSSGFLFFNNYVRNHAMPARKAMQFEVKLKDGLLRIPCKPLDIPSGAYFIWPFHRNLDGVDLRYSTAQLFTRLDAKGLPVYVFAAVRGMAAEFAFASDRLGSVRASSGAVHADGGSTYVGVIEPGLDSWIEIIAKDGRKARIVVLTAEQAEHAWRVRLEGAERLLITDADVVPVPEGSVRLLSRGERSFHFTLLPAPAHAPEASAPLKTDAGNEQAASYTATLPERSAVATVTLLQAAGIAPPVKLGPRASFRSSGVAQAPPEGALAGEGKWSIAVPDAAMAAPGELFLRIRYTGDLARLAVNEKLLNDDFFNGLDWEIGLKRYLGSKGGKLELSILPLRRDAPFFLESPRAVNYEDRGQAADLHSVRLVPEYELILGGKKQ